jgi:2-amino-4-hydroxy-6-hydroxymethyldihydropteridine diphosphokinase
MNYAFLGIGTNLSERNKNLTSALTSVENSIGVIVRLSSVYETDPWGFVTDDKFLNMVIEVKTVLSPFELLAAVQHIEDEMGRKRFGPRYRSRVIDIDILFYNDLVLTEPGLEIPHPLIADRKFVLVPFCEIAPEYVHPDLNITISDLLNSCNDTSTPRIYRQPDNKTTRQ